MLSEDSNSCYALKPLELEIVKLHYKLLLREERNDLIYGENKSGVTVNQLLGSLGELCMDMVLPISLLGFQGSAKPQSILGYSLYPSLVSQKAAGGPVSAQHTNIHFI